MRKSFPTFAQEDYKCTTKWLVNRCQTQGCQSNFFKNPV